MFPLSAAQPHRLTFHQRVLSRRRFILPLLLLIALLGASTAQAHDPTPTPAPAPTVEGKVYISSRYGYVLINWDNFIKDLETDLDPRYEVYLGPVGARRWEIAISGIFPYAFTAADGMKPDTEYEVIVTATDRWCRRLTCFFRLRNRAPKSCHLPQPAQAGRDAGTCWHYNRIPNLAIFRPCSFGGFRL